MGGIDHCTKRQFLPDSGPGGPGCYHPGLPEPDVRTLPHPVPQPTGSPSTVVPVAIRSSDGDMGIGPRCARHVSLNRVCRPTLRFPPQGPPGRVPLLQRYYQSATTSCRPSRRTSFPSLGDTSVFTRCFRSLTDECTAKAWSWSPGVSSREFAEEATGPPKFLGNLNHPFAVFQTDAGRTAGTRPLRCRSVAPGHRKAEAPTKGLSTLNSTAFGLAVYASQGRLPDTTQDSLPVAGQALRDGILTRKVPLKGFQVVIYISSPFPKLCLAQTMQPLRV